MKNKFQIFIAFIVGLTMLANTYLIVDASAPNDAGKSSSYAKDSINYLFSKGIIRGDEKGNFNPKASVTRGEAVKIIISAYGMDTTNVPDQPTFKDVPKSHWAYKYVETAYKMGITKGLTEEVFGINEFCTREQIATFYIRTLGLSQKELADVQINGLVMEYLDYKAMSDWSKPYIEFMTITELMKGNESKEFLPKEKTTKEQMAVITDRFINSTAKLNNYINLYKMANNVQLSKRYSTVYLATELPLRAFGIEEIIDENGKSQFVSGRTSYMDDRSIASYYNTYLKADQNYTMVMHIQYNTAYGPIQFRMKKSVVTDSPNKGVLSVVPVDQTKLKLYYPYANLDESYKQTSNYQITDSNNNAVSIKSVEFLSSYIVITLEKTVEIGSKLKIQVDGLKTGSAADAIKFGSFTREFSMGNNEYRGITLPNNNVEQLSELQTWTKGEVTVIYNGSSIGKADTNNIVNGELLIPGKIFESLGYEIYGDQNVGFDVETRGVTYTVKPGEKFAFRNVIAYFKPFDNVEKYKDSIVQLNAAPTYNQELLLPISILNDTKSVTIYTDDNARTISIRLNQ